MTSAGLSTLGGGSRALGAAVRRIWTDGSRPERTAYAVGAVLFLSGLVHVGILLVTGRTWIGPVSLRKAATFGLSFGLTVATLAWATSFLRMRERLRTALLTVFTATSVVETTLVSMQAWRGVPSHFNFATPFDNVVAMTLALGGFVIIVTVLGFGAAAIVGAGRMAPSMRLAVRLGLLILVVALAVGAVMIARGVVEARGGQAQLAYDTAGSLKPIHAVAMHAILVLPGIAWLLALSPWPERSRMLVVGVASAGYVLLTVVTAIESFADVSPLAAPPLGTAASILGLVALAGAGVVALRAALAGRRA